MNKTIVKFSALMLIFVTSLPNAAGMLGVSTYAATKVVDAIMAGLGFWTIVSLCAASGGSAAAVVVAVKLIIKKAGRRAAITW